MWTLTAIVFIFCQVYAQGSDCKFFTGKWYNQLGSELIISEHSGNVITGEYRTAVERFNGSAGETHSSIKGVAKSSGPGSLLGFSTMFNKGQSTASWIGECVVCAGDEALLTTWLLRKFVSNPADRWQSTHIGQDTFTRHDNVQGPRIDEGTHVPKRSTNFISASFRSSNKFSEKLREIEPVKSINGKWYSSTGVELELISEEENLKGTYSEARSVVYGLSGTDNLPATLGFSILNSDSQEIKVWVGQAHDRDNGKQMLDTSFLMQTSTKSCENSWRTVQFGSEIFSRDKNSGGFANENGSSDSLLQRIRTSVVGFFKSLF